MSRVRLVLLSLVAVLSVGALLASSASAAINFEWKVGGKALAAGEKRTFEVNNDGKVFDLHGTAGGALALLLSTKVKVKPGALIFGGRPGTNEEIVEFESVTVDNPAGCVAETGEVASPVVGNVLTKLLKTEIVEGQSGGRGNGEPLILFTPKGEPTFTAILFLNKGTETCKVAGTLGKITGSILGLPLPQRTEVVDGNLVSEATTNQYLVAAGGAAKTAGLTFAGNAATLSGLTLVILTSKEAFGAF
jgi:hypothetical protein